MTKKVADALEVIATEETNYQQNETVDIMSPVNPGWTDYVLSKLEEHEKIDGYPTVGGLTRLVHKFIGPITKSVARVVAVPNSDNSYTAVVEYEIHIGDQVYCEVGESNRFNTDAPYNKFQVATASTKARARCLRIALGLQTNASEELSAVSNIPIGADSDKINIQQINIIEMLGKRNNINIMRLANNDGANYKSCYEIPFAKATEMIKLLNTEDVKNNSELVGYTPDWRQ